jgi:hypothetical protein
MYIIETEVSRESYADGYPGPQNPQNFDNLQTCFYTKLLLTSGSHKRAHLYVVSFNILRSLIILQGHKYKNITLNIGKKILRSCYRAS